MTGAGRRATVAEELRLAEEEVDAAQALLDGGHARVAMARVYFAAFHAVRSLLYSHDLEPRTHAGVQHLYNLHLVRSGRGDAATSRLLMRLQKYREEADYSHAFVVDDAGVEEELAAVRTLLETIRSQVEREAEP